MHKKGIYWNQYGVCKQIEIHLECSIDKPIGKMKLIRLFLNNNLLLITAGFIEFSSIFYDFVQIGA